jgi:hydrogenase/urease accessory protein HupE
MHQTFVNVYEGGALRHQAILDARRTAMTYYAGSWFGVGAVLATFVPAGVHHIAIGPDHLLFLVGLLLLGGSAGRLAGVVTAFTLGHSVTLALAATGAVALPAAIVEPAIALTLVLVGADNLLAASRPDVPRRDLRAGMAGVFGLIHGFGFAAVLREFGLPDAALGWSLFGFNLGVELGQLALVLPLALALAWIRRQRPEAARRIAVIGSAVVALAGAFWFVQRLFF